MLTGFLRKPTKAYAGMYIYVYKFRSCFFKWRLNMEIGCDIVRLSFIDPWNELIYITSYITCKFVEIIESFESKDIIMDRQMAGR